MAGSEKKGFQVTDRRSFAPGESKTEGAAAETGDGSHDEAIEAQQHEHAHDLPEVDFGTFLLSLASSALLHLGEIEHPELGKTEKNLPLARHTIEVIGMLGEKTRGNLTPDEQKLIEGLLYDLRLRFVAAAKK